MNLDSNHSYGNRFVKIGDKAFNPAYVTNFTRSDEYMSVTIYFPGDDSMVFYGKDADLVWDYLTANSTELVSAYISEGPDGGIEGAGLDRPSAF
jgi:hypothetical protein